MIAGKKFRRYRSHPPSAFSPTQARSAAAAAAEAEAEAEAAASRQVLSISTDVEDEPPRRKYYNVWLRISTATLLTVGVLLLITLYYIKVSEQDPEERFARKLRNYLIREQRMRLGGKLELNQLEVLANRRLMSIKFIDNELHHIWNDYQPRPHFLSKYNISETDIYGVLRSMPKGGLLHVHAAGMLKTDMLIELTYQSNLWICVSADGEFEDFRFSTSFPESHKSLEYVCNWQLLSNFWQHQHSNDYVKKLRTTLSLKSKNFSNASELARHMRRAHRLIHGLITYHTIWPTFLFSMLQDFYEDGVTYVELRSSLPLIYDMEGTNYTILDTAHSLITVSNIFRSTYRDFIGVKLIYAPVRDPFDSRMDLYINNAKLLKENFPSFFVGFDLINFGNECQLMPLSQSVQLLHINEKIDFYFHAGESHCLDSAASDNNLIDALLLGSKRLGNALNLPQHPELLRMIKMLNVAIELCPLSNHYMQYVSDFHSHPAAFLIAAGYPIVVGSDYPYFWDAAPLTDDFYVAFVGIASGQGNLRVLKQLAMNSILYSSLSNQEKTRALSIWQQSWNDWLIKFVNGCLTAQPAEPAEAAEESVESAESVASAESTESTVSKSG